VRNARRELRERCGLDPDTAPPAREPAGRELCALIDEELHRLPDKYRAPLLLCYLEGRTTDQAARQLGWSQRTLERRLAQGRERLRARLTRQGLTLSGVLLSAALSAKAARAALPVGLAPATVRTATAPAAGTSPAVAALVERTLNGMAFTKTRLAAAVLFLLTATAGAGLLFGKVPGPARPAGPATTEPAPPPPPGPTADGKDEEKAAPAGDLAARVWAITELVRQHHVRPPARAEMLLGGARALLKVANVEPPEDLPRRAAEVAGEGQLRTFLRGIWPRPRTGPVAARVSSGDQSVTLTQQETPEKATDAGLEAALLEGLFASIPGKPTLLSEEYLKRADQLSSNRYVGVGVQLALNPVEKVPEIRTPFPRGTARRAGVRPGDLLLEVDGKSTRGVDLEQIVQWVRGPEGSPVTLTVRQPGAAEPRRLAVTRAVVPLDSVLGYRRAGDRWEYAADRDAGIGYVWIDSIKASTLHELREAERGLQAEGMRALVLDFRYSSGEGVLDHAALVADGLLDGGLLWTVRGTQGGDRVYRADRECLFRGWPLAVLVNNDLADSGQGGVLAALQDNGRATLVGLPTQTDGSVRTVFPLPGSKEAITVVTGRLERAAPGRDWPVGPDRAVETTKEQQAGIERWLRAKQRAEPAAGTDDRPPDDPQLAHALALLRDALKTPRTAER
jgi:carboxyl-terminal processing protease